MASNLPLNFTLPQESYSINYDWIDVLTGLGYINFYPMCVGGTTPAYLLTTNNTLDGYPKTWYSSSTADLINKTFETTIRQHSVIGGRVYFNCPIKVEASGTMTTTITLYKNAVNLGTSTATSTAGVYVMAQSFDIADTTLSKGDVLKATVNIRFTRVVSGDKGQTWMSPNGATGYWYVDGSAIPISTRVLFAIPFKIDI